MGLGIQGSTGSAIYNATEYNESIDNSDRYGASLNTDYTFSDRWRLKSGLEYMSQNVSVNKIMDFRAEYISVPLILYLK